MTWSRKRLPVVAAVAVGLAGGIAYSDLNSSSDTPVRAAEASVPLDSARVSMTQAIEGVTPLGAGVFDRIPDIVERVQPSVVSVLVETEQGFAEGSGVVWDGALGQIVTNTTSWRMPSTST